MNRRSVTPIALAAALLVGGCASAATAAPSSTNVAPTPSPASSGPVEASPTTDPSNPPIATPQTTGPSASPGTSPGPPSADQFWARVLDGVYLGGDRLRIDVAGAAPGELRFQKGASATVIDGELVFICVAGRAYDGQSGFVDVPGDWVCGGDALVNGLRTAGQPVDAWSADLPLDRDRSEAYSLAPTGDWRWDYRATNPILGPGQVRTTVIASVETGRILALTKFLDPLGETVYRLVYGASFPEIVKP